MIGRALVTGGAGFVGRHLVAALASRGVAVRVLDLKADVSGAECVVGSVTDADAVRAAMREVDAVFHLAGVADLWRPDPDIFERVNVGGARVVLDEARRAQVRRFVQCSSLTTLVSRAAPIGPSEADETIELSPDELIGPYPRSKRAADILVASAAADGFNASIALPTEPLGPGDDSLTPPTRMILDFANGRTPASIDCMLNFVPVDALAEGLIAVAARGARGERYVLGGENVTMARLLADIERMTGRPTPKTVLPYWVALLAGAVDTHVAARITGKAPKAPLTGVRLAGRRVALSSAKAERDLGWAATPYETALLDMLDWARGRGLLQPIS